ncbi:MAG: glycosyltransferase [Candidatus Methanomethylicaceae archaeon]
MVNISRDDFPHDANMRCFEVMAAGALLVTSLPTELADLGFEEGRHFVGFEHEQDLLEKVPLLS